MFAHIRGLAEAAGGRACKCDSTDGVGTYVYIYIYIYTYICIYSI